MNYILLLVMYCCQR